MQCKVCKTASCRKTAEFFNNLSLVEV